MTFQNSIEKMFIVYYTFYKKARTVQTTLGKFYNNK